MALLQQTICKKKIKKAMKIVSVARRLSLNGAWSHQFHQTHLLRSLSTSSFPANGTSNRETNKSESSENFEQRKFGEIPGSNSKINAFYEKLNRHTNKSESTEEFEQRMFGEIAGSNSKTDAFFEKLNRQGTTRDRSMMNDLDESFDTLSDGMDGKLKNAAKYFEYDSEEVEKEDYSFRYDATFWPYSTYDIKDLDLTKPGIRKPKPRDEFQVTTKEVLSQADFRNVRFLANFITEAGIIIKRSKTGISAKAQRKVAREIKTARAFGLMPFTTMGTKPFAFGNSMENVDDDFAYQSLDRNVRLEPDVEDI